MSGHLDFIRRCGAVAALAAATFLGGCVVAPAGYYDVGDATYIGPGYAPWGGYTAVWPTVSLGFYGFYGGARWSGRRPGWGYGNGWRGHGHGWRGQGWHGGGTWHGRGGGWGRPGGFHGGRR